MSDERPVLVAFDGSAESRAAVRSAVTLFPGRKLIVVTVWEAELARVLASISAVARMSSSAEITAETTRVQRDQAVHAACAGAQFARGLGATAESIPVTDETNVTVATRIGGRPPRHMRCGGGLAGARAREGAPPRLDHPGTAASHQAPRRGGPRTRSRNGVQWSRRGAVTAKLTRCASPRRLLPAGRRCSQPSRRVLSECPCSCRGSVDVTSAARRSSASARWSAPASSRCSARRARSRAPRCGSRSCSPGSSPRCSATPWSSSACATRPPAA